MSEDDIMHCKVWRGVKPAGRLTAMNDIRFFLPDEETTKSCQDGMGGRVVNEGSAERRRMYKVYIGVSRQLNLLQS